MQTHLKSMLGLSLLTSWLLRGYLAIILGAYLLLAGSIAVGKSAEQVAAPTVELQLIPARDKLERDDEVHLFFFVSNKSDLPIILSRVNLPAYGITEQKKSFFLPIEVPPYGSAQGAISFKASTDRGFGLQKLVLTADYFWPKAGQLILTTQSITVAIELTRRFEEESKGFPGGTAAFLYLLLPVIPAFLSYQLIERYRMNEPLKLPEFKTEHIVPSFLAAIVISFFMLLAGSKDVGINYSNPKVFITVLFTSLAAGALIPGSRFVWNWRQMRKWGFLTQETGSSYLRKALLGPFSSEPLEWVKGESQGQTVEGFLLKEPNKSMVLGPQLQVSPKVTADAAFTDGTLRDPQMLVDMAEQNTVRVRVNAAVKRGNKDLPGMATLHGLGDFKQSSSDGAKPFIVLTT